MTTHCDSPRVRVATNGGRVIGETGKPAPADTPRDSRRLPVLPVCSPRQRINHPRAEAFAKPHRHRTACGHGVVCDDRRDCRTAECVTCAALAECSTCRAWAGCRCDRPAGKLIDLAGRAAPLTILPHSGAVKPLNTNRKKRNGRRPRLRASA